MHYMGSPRTAVLKKQIQERLAIRGIHCRDDELIVTSGACQAIDLAARVFLDEQTAAAVEAPVYMEALEIFKNYTTSQLLYIFFKISPQHFFHIRQVRRHRGFRFIRVSSGDGAVNAFMLFIQSLHARSFRKQPNFSRFSHCFQKERGDMIHEMLKRLSIS